MGLLGVIVAIFVIYGHLAHLRSFGTPYLQPVAPLILEDWKDTLLRAPNPFMTKRSTSFTDRINDRRQKKQ
ncbi:Spore germination protein B1 [compost metagenome]